MRYSVFQVSRKGGRDDNEDRVAHSYTRETGLFVLADGMGGHPEGEVAAQLAVDSVASMFHRVAQPALSDPQEFLSQALLSAHHNIIRYSIQKKFDDSPRTTLVAAVVQGGQAHWVHCGDSRLYLTRGKRLLSRTRDHSYIEQQNAGIIRTQLINRNILFSCLGSPTKPIFELGGPTPLEPGDRMMLCSDGLWDNLDDVRVVHELSRQPVAKSAPNMVEQALRAGGARCDNVTVIAMEWQSADSEEDTLRSPLAARASQGYATTIQAGSLEPGQIELDEAEIERSIAEINAAIRRASQRKGAVKAAVPHLASSGKTK